MPTDKDEVLSRHIAPFYLNDPSVPMLDPGVPDGGVVEEIPVYEGDEVEEDLYEGEEDDDDEDEEDDED